MICIIKFDQFNVTPDAIKGWIVATDTHDARRQAEAALERELAQELYRYEFPSPGKYPLSTGHIMLVS